MNYWNCWSSSSMLSPFCYLLFHFTYVFLLLDFSALCRLWETTYLLTTIFKSAWNLQGLNSGENPRPLEVPLSPSKLVSLRCIVVSGSPSLNLGGLCETRSLGEAAGRRQFCPPRLHAAPHWCHPWHEKHRLHLSGSQLESGATLTFAFTYWKLWSELCVLIKK